jgi:hypothetical protein
LPDRGRSPGCTRPRSFATLHRRRAPHGLSRARHFLAQCRPRLTLMGSCLPPTRGHFLLLRGDVR